MKSTGIVRRLDEVGRIVIPKEIRNTFAIEEGTPLEIFINGDQIVIQKYTPGDIFTGETEELLNYKGRYISRKTIEELAVMAGITQVAKAGDDIESQHGKK